MCIYIYIYTYCLHTVNKQRETPPGPVLVDAGLAKALHHLLCIYIYIHRERERYI